METISITVLVLMNVAVVLWIWWLNTARIRSKWYDEYLKRKEKQNEN